MSLPLPQTDLSLTALRYLAGELDGSNLSEFEQLLATDDAAQQALVQAVQISAAIQTGSTSPAVIPATRVSAMRSPQRTPRWSGVAALACCALVVATAIVALRGEPDPEVTVASSEEANTGATVSLWTELDVDDIAASLDDSSLYDSDGESADGVQVPDWMFAAIETDSEANDPATDPGTETPL